MAHTETCMACGKPIVLIHWPPTGVHLGRAWVHVSRFGRVKLRAKHKPVPPWESR